MFRQEFFADPWFVIEAVQRSFRGDLYQVAIALFVLCQDKKMVVRVAVRRRALNAMIVLLADVKLATDDGLNSGGFGGVHKMHSAKNIAVVSHGHGRHAQLFDAMAELFDVASAVEHRIVSMKMKVNALRHVEIRR